MFRNFRRNNAAKQMHNGTLTTSVYYHIIITGAAYTRQTRHEP